MRTYISEERRHPGINEAGRRLLRRLQEHAFAPNYNFACGDQLDGATLERVRQYEAGLYTEPCQAAPGGMPESLRRAVQRCCDQVPHYRRLGSIDFEQRPTLKRDEIQNTPWLLVPDDEPLEPMMAYDSSGTTGSKLWVMSHPFVSSAYLAILKRTLKEHGVDLEGGPDRVSIAMISYQEQTLTYATVSSFLGQAGFVKLNLIASDWRHADDRVRFLDECAPEVYTGSPLSFVELARLPLRSRPKALISTSMALLPGLKQSLETRFGCPVIDVYSMCECRAVAASNTGGLGLMRPDAYVEILDDADRPCPPDQVGNVVVTSTLNPFLPLLRYRTGDHGRLSSINGLAVLRDFEGRSPTQFVTAGNGVVNNIDVTIAIRHLALAQVRLHQAADRSLHMQWRGHGVAESDVREAVLTCLGDLPLTLSALEGPVHGKGLQYQSLAMLPP